ncbi:polysaccharide deacetylase family protein [Kitasatospora sp. NBC_01246]|uniref:polysaccharide deacetylase family protein n=1 Tax=Kitasatospora sp. NBC_01246 TaxID=2903570 RepID=UPI002E3820FD|nr:polysaccharide deacetylase family protein [Kitasatospora sp. NBC_01246]
MPEHTTSQRPSPSVRRRRRLLAGCVAVVASLALAACGTANGALQPQPGTTASGNASGTTASGTGAPAPSASPAGSPSGSSSASSSPSSSPPSGSAPAAAPPGDAVPASKPATGGPATPKPPAPPRTPAPSKTPVPAKTPSTAPATRPPTTAPAPPAPPATGVSTSVVRSTASGGRTVALTFDDGPGPATGEVLDVLARYGVKATFCQIGQQAAAQPAMVKRIRAAGHRLCDHTVSHPLPFAPLSHDKAASQISGGRDMIVRAGGPGTEVAWFRAPGGGFTADNQHIAAAEGLRPLGWSVDPRDWSRPGVASIVSTVQSQLRPGGVILMHDGGGDRSQTVAALKQLLPWLIAQGYRFDLPAR